MYTIIETSHARSRTNLIIKMQAGTPHHCCPPLYHFNSNLQSRSTLKQKPLPNVHNRFQDFFFQKQTQLVLLIIVVVIQDDI